ncbi:diaminopimelate epimerase [Methanobrevibacter sp. OttesenSCG-928-K11]|nr:diaminopimelate epimerase [Methanobrevibacter sp. OttesenSCG-928-K11]MDL2270410.1 diaminopimelate epimerase [Methanobrevibacter sp. OttesenSCG-928-I08]
MSFKGLKFSKMHGIGNDFIIIDESKKERVPENKKCELSRFICDRHMGVGGDGVLFVSPSTKADINYRMFNPDGSEAEMCGNGIRCFADFVYRNEIIKKETMEVETKSGIKTINIIFENDEPVLFKVDMGTSTFKTKEIPMTSDKEEFINEKFDAADETFNLTAISVGNPHAIVFVDNIDEIDLDIFGPAIEQHELFPNKINVHFVEATSKNEGKMITWERGAGITLACGTGATATAIVGYKLGYFDKDILLHLPGGDLNFNVYEKNNEIGTLMEGPATLVFNGEL